MAQCCEIGAFIVAGLGRERNTMKELVKAGEDEVYAMNYPYHQLQISTQANHVAAWVMEFDAHMSFHPAVDELPW